MSLVTNARLHIARSAPRGWKSFQLPLSFREGRCGRVGALRLLRPVSYFPDINGFLLIALEYIFLWSLSICQWMQDCDRTHPSARDILFFHGSAAWEIFNGRDSSCSGINLEFVVGNTLCVWTGILDWKFTLQYNA